MRFIPVYHPELTPGDARAVEQAVARGQISATTPVVTEFEARWAARCGMPYGAAVANGTAALELAVRALGIQSGDEVVCPSFTIVSCVRAIVAAGAAPVLVDVDPLTYCLDVEACRERIGPRTRAVLGVHMYGHPYAHAALSELLASRGVFVIEDAAQAHGAAVLAGASVLPCGGLGDVSTFSFFANKPVTTGEGGMVLARDAAVAQRVRYLANLSFGPRRFVHEELSPNYRLSSLQAALGISQMERLDQTVATKRRIAAEYAKRLARIDEFVLQGTAGFALPIHWMIAGTLRDERVDREEVTAALARRGVETRPFFWGMHEQPALRSLGYFQGERYPVTERLARRGFYLPSGLDLDEETIERVAFALGEAIVEARGRAVVAPAVALPSKAVEPPGGTASVFGASYAEVYDLLYADKDYEHEASVLKRAFDELAPEKVARVLDLGCGTGRHALALRELGYDVTGVDRSPSMLAIARTRLGPSAELFAADVREVSLSSADGRPRLFDAVTILFAVLSYQITAPDVLAALAAARRHLAPGGLLLFDVWYGPAVMRSPPARRVKRVTAADGVEWTRVADGRHEPHAQCVHVTYDLTRTRGSVTDVLRETHPMHYFFPHELEHALSRSGFELLRLTGFECFGEPPRLDDYTVVVVARAL